MSLSVAILSWESLHSIAVGGPGAHVSESAAAPERQGRQVDVFTRTGPGRSRYERLHGVH